MTGEARTLTNSERRDVQSHGLQEILPLPQLLNWSAYETGFAKGDIRLKNTLDERGIVSDLKSEFVQGRALQETLIVPWLLGWSAYGTRSAQRDESLE
jgi:hypothetical protein